MSPSVSESIREVLDNSSIPSHLHATILTFLNNYHTGQWIYPGVLIRKFGLSSSTAYSFLNNLEKKGLLDSYYELYCGRCQRSSGKVHLLNELPEMFICDGCDEELPSLEHSVLIFKVIHDAF